MNNSQPDASSDDSTSLWIAPEFQQRQSASSPAQETAPHWPLIEGYQLVRPLSSDEHDSLFEAIHLATRTWRLLRILPLGATISAALSRRLEIFAREGSLATAVNHPNMMGIGKLCRTESFIYFDMPMVVGPSLAQLTEQWHPLDPEQLTSTELLAAAKLDPSKIPLEVQQPSATPDYYRLLAYWMAQAADALGTAHAYDLLHLGLKPSNVHLSPEHRLVLTGFGYAKLREQEYPPVRELAFQSPEQLQDPDSVDHRTDLYALGVILHEFLSGRAAFHGASRREMHQAILRQGLPRAQNLRPGVPEALSEICWYATRIDPERRVGSARQIRDALRGWLGSTTLLRPKPSWLQRILAHWRGSKSSREKDL